MKQQPRVVHYIDWDIVLKCKSCKYGSIGACLKSIWTEEYANPIESYNLRTMIQIMGQVLEEIMPIERRARLLDSILRCDNIITEDELLCKLYLELHELQVREKVFLNKYEDLYIIKYKDKYYTIDQYSELKEENKND